VATQHAGWDATLEERVGPVTGSLALFAPVGRPSSQVRTCEGVRHGWVGAVLC
jgi:hypothetical protein